MSETTSFKHQVQIYQTRSYTIPDLTTNASQTDYLVLIIQKFLNVGTQRNELAMELHIHLNLSIWIYVAQFVSALL